MSQASVAQGPAPSVFRRPFKFWNPANIVIVVSTGLIAIMFAIFAALCVQGYYVVQEQAEFKAQAGADIVAKESGLMLSGARALLRYLVMDARTPSDPTRFDPSALTTAIAAMPMVLNFGLYDATGRALAGMGSPSLPATMANVDFFKLLVGGGKDWTVSSQLSDEVTGLPIFVVAQKSNMGGAGAVALLVLSGGAMQEFWEPLKLGEASTTSLLTEDGWVVARYPAVSQAVNAKQAPAFTTFKDQETGTYISERSPVDGIARVVGFRRLPDLGVVAVASISQDAIFGPLWTSIITVLWLMVPIAAALLAGSLITAHIVRRSQHTQANLAAAVAHNEVLFREIHHRVKNNLQSVASLLQMQPIPREVKANMGQRIAAMSAVHEHIYRSNNFSTVDVRGYLQTLIENIRAGADPKVQVVTELEDLNVDKDAATPLGLILNEVLSNAFKHAFPDGREGSISVQLKSDGKSRGRLTVADNGVGYDPAQPAKGIGRRLIEALVLQLGGESTTTSAGSGSTFTLSFPLVK